MFTGTPGSGKSLHVAENISSLNKRGVNFILNFEFDFLRYKNKKCGIVECKENYEITVDYLKVFAEKNHKLDKHGRMIEKQTILVLDECQIMFNARNWNAPGRMDWNIFFTQHRKYGYDIILVTQYDRLVDRQIRSCVEFEMKHRNVSYFKIYGKILGLLTGNRMFVCVKYWYQINEKCDSNFFFYKSKIGRLYNSYKIFDEKKEVKKDVKKTIVEVPADENVENKYSNIISDSDISRSNL